MLAKDKAFTAVVVITLALGIGANTTVFTLVNAVLFKGLPFDRADRLMHLSSRNLSKAATEFPALIRILRTGKLTRENSKDWQPPPANP
jgi:hypothetical protein